ATRDCIRKAVYDAGPSRTVFSLLPLSLLRVAGTHHSLRLALLVTFAPIIRVEHEHITLKFIIVHAHAMGVQKVNRLEELYIGCVRIISVERERLSAAALVYVDSKCF